MFMERKITLQPQGSDMINYVVLVGTNLTGTQRNRIISCLRAWRRPGRLRWLRQRFGEPFLSNVAILDDSSLQISFRDLNCRNTVMQSTRLQTALMAIIPETLGWPDFTYRRNFSSGFRQYSVTRESPEAPWSAEDISPPDPPRLRQPITQLDYRRT